MELCLTLLSFVCLCLSLKLHSGLVERSIAKAFCLFSIRGVVGESAAASKYKHHRRNTYDVIDPFMGKMRYGWSSFSLPFFFSFFLKFVLHLSTSQCCV